MLKQIMRLTLAFVLVVHAVIHLGIIPGGLQGTDGTTGWSGQSWLLDPFLNNGASASIAITLLIGTILFFSVGALGLLGTPVLKGIWKTTISIGSILSLLLFAVTWTGILPHPFSAIWGAIISGGLLIGLLITWLLEQTTLQSRLEHAIHRGIVAH